MTRHLGVRALVVVGLVALGPWPVPLSASWAGDGVGGEPEARSVVPWTYATVDSTHDVGPHVAVAVHPDTGEPYVSYRGELSGGLRFARLVAGHWSTQLVHPDTGPDLVGQHSSIVVYTGAQGLEVAISYHEQGSGSLMVATGHCGDTCAFDIWWVDGGNPPNGSYTGLYTSAKYSQAAGWVEVAYQENQLYGGETLKLAQGPLVGGGGNCGGGTAAGLFNCWGISSGEGVGAFATLTHDSHPWPHITYYDGARPNHWWYTDSGWGLDSADIPGQAEGVSVSHYLDQTDTMHMAFLNPTTDELVYARYVGAGGNCGLSSVTLQWEYECSAIDDVGVVDLSRRTAAIAQGPGGDPIIAYRDAPDLWYSSLKTAEPGFSFDPSQRCGPMNLWTCTIVHQGTTHLDEAGAVSIASNEHGTAIAYQEYDDYHHRGSLKVMYRLNPLFADGFETGTTSAWSSAQP